LVVATLCPIESTTQIPETIINETIVTYDTSETIVTYDTSETIVTYGTSETIVAYQQQVAANQSSPMTPTNRPHPPISSR